eukprot:COSAG04_NODE_21860_length_366_cov_0.662921_2_plen_44_part_01
MSYRALAANDGESRHVGESTPNDGAVLMSVRYRARSAEYRCSVA